MARKKRERERGKERERERGEEREKRKREGKRTKRKVGEGKRKEGKSNEYYRLYTCTYRHTHKER